MVPVELLLCPKSMIVVPEERRLWCLRIGIFVLSLLAWFLRTSQEWLCSYSTGVVPEEWLCSKSTGVVLEDRRLLCGPEGRPFYARLVLLDILNGFSYALSPNF